MRVTFDTNILVYAFDPAEPEKRRLAQDLITRFTEGRATVPLQVLSETLNAAHRKRKLSVDLAREACEIVERRCVLEPTLPADLISASSLAERHKIQFFDALICTVSMRAGIDILLSEDMHDGLRLGFLEIVNPFIAANEPRIRTLFSF